MVKHRAPLQVDDEFLKKLKEIRKKFMMTVGEPISLREITQRIAKSPEMKAIENEISRQKNIKIDFNIKFDGRAA
jgi:hypothetical protein